MLMMTTVLMVVWLQLLLILSVTCSSCSDHDAPNVFDHYLQQKIQLVLMASCLIIVVVDDACLFSRLVNFKVNMEGQKVAVFVYNYLFSCVLINPAAATTATTIPSLALFCSLRTTPFGSLAFAFVYSVA